jgi:hypothetical protein
MAGAVKTLKKRQPQSAWKTGLLWSIALLAMSALLGYQYKRHNYASYQCDPSEFCRDTRHAFLLGGDSGQQVEAELELHIAADVYRKWVGADPPHGLLRLNSTLALPASGYDNIAWSLTFDRRRSRILGSPSSIKEEVSKRSQVSEETATSSEMLASPSFAALDHHEILGHEICHQLALLVFRSKPRGNQALPEALGETAAVSCESPSLQRSRVLDFVRVLRDSKHVPWERLFKISHPINDSALLARLKKKDGSGNNNIIKFSFERNSELGEKVAAYYGQVAALALFLDRTSCPEYRALGNLLQSYDPRAGFDKWLSTHGKQNCLPTSTANFTKAIQSFVYSYEL